HQVLEGIPEKLAKIAELLRNQLPEAGPLELDRIKPRVKASRRRPVLMSGKGYGFMRSRAIGVLIVAGMLGGGTGALAAAGGLPVHAFSKGKESANSQYCPPTSQQPGKPKKPGPAKCGKPKTKKVKAKSCRKNKGKSRKHHARKSARVKAKSCIRSRRHVKAHGKKGHGKSKSKAHGKAHGKKK